MKCVILATHQGDYADDLSVYIGWEYYMKKYILLALAVLGALIFWPSPTVDEVMADFHKGEGRKEDELMDTLCANTELVKTRVIEEIKNHDMDKRRYAISFLGEEKVVEATPVLKGILSDDSEKDFFRGDALCSLYLIDKSVGLKYAQQYEARDDFLGYIAKKILKAD